MQRLCLLAVASVAVAWWGPAHAGTYCDERIILCPVEAGDAAEARPSAPAAQRTGKTRHAGRPLRIVPFPPERVRVAAPASFPTLGPVMALALAEEAEAVLGAVADHSDVSEPAAVEPLRALQFTLDTARTMRALAQLPTSACLVEQTFEDLKAGAPLPKLRTVAQLNP
ncbi:MAG TPA: hypothetical protein VGD36_16490 [Xanthobacteraceae bacterium]|jgi:hypothetical protein